MRGGLISQKRLRCREFSITETAHPKKCVWRNMNCPPSANMFMIRAPFPRAIGTEFSGVLEGIGSTEGRVHPRVSYVLAQGNIALDRSGRLGFSSGHTPGLNLVDAHASAAP
jgi:hypothetical protein